MCHGEQADHFLRIAFLKRKMHGTFCADDADKSYHEQNKEYFEGEQIAAARIADVSGYGCSYAADEGCDRAGEPHNLWEFGPAKVVGHQILHGYGLYPLAHSINDAECENRLKRLREQKDGKAGYAEDYRENSQ